MTTDNPQRTTSVAQPITALLLFASSVSLAFYGTLQGTQLVLGQLKYPIIQGVLWPMSIVGAVLLILVGIAVSLSVVLGALESVSQPRIRNWTAYTLIGAGGLAGIFGACFTTLLNWNSMNQLLSGPLLSSTPIGLAALAVIVIPLGGAFYRLWRPSDQLIAARSRTSQSDPPPPEVVRDRRVKRSAGVEPDAPPTPTPQDRFTASDQDVSATPESEVGDGSSHVDFSDLEYHWTTETDVSMENIGGMEELKQTLHTDVIRPLTTGREKAEKLGIPLPNIVFHGPPGTGKTYMAEALATELGLPFAKLSGSDVQSKWINESAQKINTLFEEAKMVADSEGGAVVFLDELDAVLKQRETGGSAHEEDNKVVAEFLNHLQDTAEHDILFIGATNRLEALDDAGVRSGRIDKKIHVDRPDHDAREAILRAQLEDRPHRLTDDQIERIASCTDGLVAADLEGIVIDAARNSAFGRGSKKIVWDDVVEALDQKA